MIKKIWTQTSLAHSSLITHIYAQTMEVVGREIERSAKQSDNRLRGEK